MSRSIATLAAYRKYCATSSSAVQVRGAASRGGGGRSHDERARRGHAMLGGGRRAHSAHAPRKRAPARDCFNKSSPALAAPRAPPLSPQLILPEALKLLPLYALALLKSAALRPDVRADERSLWLAAAVSLGASRVMGLLHGRLFPLHRWGPPAAPCCRV
jgi:hypothetical protein